MLSFAILIAPLKFRISEMNLNNVEDEVLIFLSLSLEKNASFLISLLYGRILAY